MKISVTEAKGQLTDLVRRAEAGDDVILTRHGHAAVRLVPVRPVADAKSRKALLAAGRAATATKDADGPSAARSQDFLYGDDGLPACEPMSRGRSAEAPVKRPPHACGR